MPDSFVESMKERANLVRQQSKRFSIASMGSMRWSYNSSRSESAVSTASSVSSIPSTTTLSDTSSIRHYSHRSVPAPRRHGKSPVSSFEPLYLQKLRQDDERRLRLEIQKAQRIQEEDP